MFLMSSGSHGILASKSAYVSVRTVGEDRRLRGDQALERFHTQWGSDWVAGRITVTRLGVSVVPHRAARGVATLDLRLSDLRGVDLPGGRAVRTLQLRTPGHVLSVRTAGADALARRIAEFHDGAAA